jgi:hypothetical protein
MEARPLSASSISTYDTCAFKYYLGYCRKIEMPNNSGAVKGTLFHYACENCANQKKKTGNYSPPLAFFDEAKKKLTEEEKKLLKRSDYNDVRQWLKKFNDDMQYYMSHEILDTETEFIMAFDAELNKIPEDQVDKIDVNDRFLIKGFIDLVLKKDDGIHIVDFKTGKRSKSPQALRKDIQPKMYALAIQHLWPKATEYTLTFDYIHTSPAVISFNQGEINEIKDYLMGKWRQILGDNKPTRRPNWMCNRFCVNFDNVCTPEYIRLHGIENVFVE